MCRLYACVFPYTHRQYRYVLYACVYAVPSHSTHMFFCVVYSVGMCISVCTYMICAHVSSMHMCSACVYCLLRCDYPC